MVNILLVNGGFIDKGIPFLTEKWHWAVSYLLIAVWQNMGWGTIIYLAAITGINGELYEAAYLDGSTRWKNIWYITLPGIKGTAITILIMNLGRIMGSNFERLDSFGNVQVKEFQYQLAIYIYEKGLSSGIFSRATAVGLSVTWGYSRVVLAVALPKVLGKTGLFSEGVFYERHESKQVNTQYKISRTPEGCRASNIVIMIVIGLLC